MGLKLGLRKLLLGGLLQRLLDRRLRNGDDLLQRVFEALELCFDGRHAAYYSIVVGGLQ